MTKSIYPTQHFFQGSAVQEQTDSQLNIRIEPQEREITQEETEEAEEQSKPTELAEQPFTPEEQQLSEQLYQAQQRENYCERQTERFERLSKYSLDEGNVREYKARTREWEERLEKVKQSVNNLKNSIAKSVESGIISITSNAHSRNTELENIIQKCIKQDKPVFANDLAINFAKIKPEKGRYIIALHGTPYSTYLYEHKIDEKILANIIRSRKDYNGEIIVLISCNTGNTENTKTCFAQKLANELGVAVYAPTRFGAILSNGKYYSSDVTGLVKEGIFKKFIPKKKE